jgi:hypothetical protein
LAERSGLRDAGLDIDYCDQGRIGVSLGMGMIWLWLWLWLYCVLYSTYGLRALWSSFGSVDHLLATQSLAYSL